MLILGGVSGAGMMTVVEEYRALLMVLTFALLGSAFYLTYRRRPVAGPASNVSAINKVVLWGVTLLAAGLLLFPPDTSRLLPSSDAISPELEQTAFQIEGMT